MGLHPCSPTPIMLLPHIRHLLSASAGSVEPVASGPFDSYPDIRHKARTFPLHLLSNDLLIFNLKNPAVACCEHGRPMQIESTTMLTLYILCCTRLWPHRQIMTNSSLITLPECKESLFLIAMRRSVAMTGVEIG